MSESRPWWKHPIWQGLIGIALGFVLYNVALDWWFLHTARKNDEATRAIMAAQQRMIQQQQSQAPAPGAGK